MLRPVAKLVEGQLSEDDRRVFEFDGERQLDCYNMDELYETYGQNTEDAVFIKNGANHDAEIAALEDGTYIVLMTF